MKTILIGVLFWVLVIMLAGCSGTGKKFFSHNFFHPMQHRVDKDGNVISTQEAAWKRNRAFYASSLGDLDELNESLWHGDDLFGNKCKTPQRSLEERIASPFWIIENHYGPYSPLGGDGYYRYQGRLHRIPQRNTAAYDWYLRRKAWGDFK